MMANLGRILKRGKNKNNQKGSHKTNSGFYSSLITLYPHKPSYPTYTQKESGQANRVDKIPKIITDY